MELAKDFAGARLLPGESIGRLVGSVRFPKRGSYRVKFAVVSSSPYDPSAVGSNADDTGEEGNTERASKPIDEWKLFVGSDYDSLQLQSFCDPSGTVRSLLLTRAHMFDAHIVTNVCTYVFIMTSSAYRQGMYYSNLRVRGSAFALNLCSDVLKPATEVV